MTRFVVFEGADGSGKTTLREHVLSRLRARNVDALTVPQVSWLDPCAAAVITASRFRQGAGLCGPTQPAVTDAVVRDKEALTQCLVEPQLSRRHVLGDRHVASDLVYHDVLFGIDPTRLYDAFRNSNVRMPDIQVFVDTPPAIAARRLRARSAELDPSDAPAVQRDIYDRFREVLLGGAYGGWGEVVVLDNSGPMEVTLEQLDDLVLPRLLRGRRRQPITGSDGRSPRDEAPPGTGGPSLEDAWTLLADGIHTHRYFLHVARFRQAREHRLHAARVVAHGADLPSPTALRQRLRGGVIEHLLHPAQPRGIWSLLSLQPAPTSAVELCGVPVVVARGDAQLPGSDGEAGPLDAHLLMTGRPAVGPATAKEVGNLIEAAGLGYAVALGLDVLVEGHREPTSERVVTSAPLATAMVSLDGDVLTLAEQIVVSAASSLLQLFLVTTGSREPADGLVVPGGPGPVGARAALFDVLALGVSHRLFRSIVDGTGPRLDPRLRRRAVARLDLTHERARAIGPLAYDLASSSGSAVVHDFVATLVPGPRQFDAFRADHP